MKTFTLALVAAAITAAPAIAHDGNKVVVPTTIAPSDKDAGTSAANAGGKTDAPKPHSGGTDAYGCHTNHQTGEYHCHNPKNK